MKPSIEPIHAFYYRPSAIPISPPPEDVDPRGDYEQTGHGGFAQKPQV
jgi:hypothetical protein